MNLDTVPSQTCTGVWTLVECCEEGESKQKFSVPAQPTRIGRTSETHITLDCSSVSKNHAEIQMQQGRPLLTDLHSTNGTFVNGRKVERTPLADGDVVQFASKVFRVQKPQATAQEGTIEGNAMPFAAALLQFEELMSQGSVVPHFQPIVRLPDGQVEGYELLARSRLEELKNPATMFSTAARLGQECALSELMRREGTRDALRLPMCKNLFVNTHPKEIVQDRFLNSLSELRELAPALPITIEIHEAAITKSDDMKRFRDVLQLHSMQLAYDDFGAGQARLDELTGIPPDYLKFDIKLVRDINKASTARQSMVSALVKMTLDLEITPLAEGIETAQDATVCHEMGFQLAQGFHFGKPAPLDELR